MFVQDNEKVGSGFMRANAVESLPKLRNKTPDPVEAALYVLYASRSGKLSSATILTRDFFTSGNQLTFAILTVVVPKAKDPYTKNAARALETKKMIIFLKRVIPQSYHIS